MFLNILSIKEHIGVKDVEGILELIDAGKVGKLVVRSAALTKVAHWIYNLDDIVYMSKDEM